MSDDILNADVNSLVGVINDLLAPGKVLRMGIVTALNTYTGRCSVRWGANPAATPEQPYVENYLPKVGDSVWGVTDENVTLILGRLGSYSTTGQPETVRQLAWAISNITTGGACKGKYGDGTGAGVTSIPVGASDVDLSLGLTNVPVLPNRLLRCSIRINDADIVDGGYRTTTLYSNWGGGGFYPFRRNTHYANGDPGTAWYGPVMDSWLFVTPTNATTLALKTYGNTHIGTAYYYRYATYTGQDQSQILLEDLGSAKDFLDQGASFG